jgi:hypothetical protein
MSQYLGYQHPGYAASLSHLGTLQRLEHARGWILVRSIGKTNPQRDAMGLYPFSCFENVTALPHDLEVIGQSGLVSLVVVTDPMISLGKADLYKHFDVTNPFKEHFIADLSESVTTIASRHHSYYARKAGKELRVALVEDPTHFLDDWVSLYSRLTNKHSINDLRAFPRSTFAQLLRLPGIVVFKAMRDHRVVGAQIFLIQDTVAHAHLAAFSEEGYEYGASYLLDWCAFDYFTGKVNHINWGGGAGAADPQRDGLARYKQGWSNRQCTSYLLGKIFDPNAYQAICKTTDQQNTDNYFPAYRAGEFNAAISADSPPLTG